MPLGVRLGGKGETLWDGRTWVGREPSLLESLRITSLLSQIFPEMVWDVVGCDGVFRGASPLRKCANGHGKGVRSVPPSTD